MTKSFRFGSAISLVTLATMIGGCAAPQSRVAVGLGKPSGDDVGVATRALAALSTNDIPTAISLSERAVEKTPDDAGFRALLGNSYFAGGRFASAEAAYKDSLSLYQNQPQVILKLALVQIAQGENEQAVAGLYSARGMIDPADYGLALALAGHPRDAVEVLETAAREPMADARVRQNLALAFALSGDWTQARTVASQDVPGNQLDARIHQWMQLANPAKPSDQVASLIGIQPAASDPGQPVRLALNKGSSQLARADVAPVPAPTVAPQVAQVLETPVQTAPEPTPAVAEATPPAQSVTATLGEAHAPQASFTPAAVAPAPLPPVFKPAKLRKASAPAAKRVPFRNAALRKGGHANAVVQLGAYGNAQRVAAAWNVVAHRFAVVRGYTPVSARFDSPRGTFYRLSVKGFTSVGEAQNLCVSLRRAGGSCFVRSVAGDAPVQIASR
jgi:Flp pilus assembly protein TadD